MRHFLASPAILPTQLPAGSKEDLSTGYIYDSTGKWIAIDNNDGTAVGVDASGNFNSYNYIIPNGGIAQINSMPDVTTMVSTSSSLTPSGTTTSALWIVMVIAAIGLYLWLSHSKGGPHENTQS